MNKIKAVIVLSGLLLLGACQSGVNFEFATTQDHTECLRENPSQNCSVPKN